jgi:CheY-like chemotaxis protein
MAHETIRVLIVDDNLLDAEVSATALRESDLVTELATARDESELRLALAKADTDVVLCDFSFPQFDGVQAVAVVREYDAHVPLIFVSGTISEERAVVALQCGAVDYVLKTNLTRLPSAVRRAVDEAQVRRRLRGSVMVAELHQNRQHERLGALWRIANEPNVNGEDLLATMLREAAGALRAPQPFAGILTHVVGNDLIVLAATLEDEDGRGRVPEVGARMPLASTLAVKPARTETWDVLTAEGEAPAAAVKYGWRSVITTRLAIGEERYFLTFASLEPNTKPFGPETLEYAELIASAFAMRIRLGELETSLRASKERANFELERLERLWDITNVPGSDADEVMAAMLGDAAASIRPDVVFRSSLARIDGAKIVLTLVVEPDDFEAAVDTELPFEGSILQKLVIAGGGTRAFDDLFESGFESRAGRAFAWRSLIANIFSVGETTYGLTFFHTEPLDDGFGPHDLLYVQILGALFARLVQSP